MIGYAFYNKKTEKDFVGRKVRSLVPLQNGYITIPAGTIFRIKAKRSGFSLEAEPCAHCGIKPLINKVPPTEVDFEE